jgi:hypothetical protein
MGIGILLVGFYIGALVVAFGTGLVLMMKTRRENADKSESFRKSPLLQFFIPIGIALSFLIMIIGYIVWCEVVLGEDSGFGEDWQIRLVNKYSLAMVDTMEEGYLEEPDGRTRLSGIRKIGQDGDLLFGEAEGNYFIVDTASKQVLSYFSEQGQQDKLAALRVKTVILYTPKDFYFRNRKWGLYFLPFILLGVVIYYVINRQTRKTTIERAST